MADTVLTELKIHEFDSVEQMSQYESEIGENDIVYTPDTSIRLPILTPMWFDHQVNDESWLNADTFSWQSGDVYKAAYDHLTADFETATTGYGWAGDTTGSVYITKGMPRVGDTVVGGGYTVGEVGSDYIAVYKNGVEYEYATRNSAYDGTADTSQTDTIGDITITYYQAKDGHRICLPDQESNLVALYEATGVAWYYILDTANKQFKLPREKPMSGMVVGNGELGIINANVSSPANASVSTVWQSGASGNPLVLANPSIASAGTALGVSGDGKKSGLAVERISDNRYLYFWVGAFDQTATEQTAGLNAEMFNGKADRNLLNTTDNVDIVVESQLPTEDNGHTWYRLYKSGWVEQGGSALGAGPRTATFPVPMADTNYNVMAVANRSNADAITGVSFTTKTTTSVNFAVSNINKDSYTWNSQNGVRWEVKGVSKSAPQQPNIYPGQD